MKFTKSVNNIKSNPSFLESLIDIGYSIGGESTGKIASGLAVEKIKQIDNKFWIIGVGGFGCRAVDYLKIFYPNITMYAIDTEKSDLSKLTIENQILIGKELTGGYGTGHNPVVAKKSIQESSKIIENILTLNADKILFIIAGLGLGTGSGATPEIVKMANQLGYTPNVLAICFMLWGVNKDPRGILKDCFDKLQKLECSLSYYDEDFLRKETGHLIIKLAFEKTCLILKHQLDKIIENYN